MKVATRRLLEEQIAAVVVPGRGEKNDVMWHEPQQCCVCCTRSGVTRCTHFAALYLCLMCQSGLHVVLLSHIGILICLPTAEPRSTAGLLFPSQYLPGTISLTPYSMVWDWRVSRAGRMPFVSLVVLSFFVFNNFRFLFFSSIG